MKLFLALSLAAFAIAAPDALVMAEPHGLVELAARKVGGERSHNVS